MDESGDPGFKIERGSSPYFVVALVVFENEAIAEHLERCVHELRKELSFHPQYEFKFNKLSRELRLRLLRTISDFPFQYYGVVLNKSELSETDARAKESFYQYVSRLVCTNAQAFLKDATVVIDGSGSREFRRSMEAHLRRHLNTDRQVIRRVQLRDSSSNSLLQVADMVTGALARSFSDKSDAHDYRAVLRRREVHELLPENAK